MTWTIINSLLAEVAIKHDCSRFVITKASDHGQTTNRAKHRPTPDYIVFEYVKIFGVEMLVKRKEEERE